MTDARSPGPTIVYRCHACEHEFPREVPGVTTCPRCQAIARHEQIDRIH